MVFGSVIPGENICSSVTMLKYSSNTIITRMYYRKVKDRRMFLLPKLGNYGILHISQGAQQFPLACQ
jgi:hypothetical protein